MLACVRRRVQSVLPRPLAFSTLPPRQEDVQNITAHVETMSDLAYMLHHVSASPIIPGINHGDQSVYLYCPLFKFIYLLQDGSLSKQIAYVIASLDYFYTIYLCRTRS